MPWYALTQGIISRFARALQQILCELSSPMGPNVNADVDAD
ncbi:protein of unknown function (plasmid) [Cupriavidus taiwanensis]|uniref:Uncharacterized protein n=1 Tax=Cupriavidus taiwanensis TaxID=164546 RepID=A0A375HET2_9BURK|nr:protein of unknown function [Cupriavidus taiwanensis]SOZ72082.1 protein of unknown function [Cupriavidus taiwanensis]SOZ74391.1 protein of unknown function [Cupriavidus taiwanensis]SPA03298.1 protein of unknown function [Cupriavidus taiwanensis]SPA11272.1 protein of unknown function [Cupriavidus taiwanensis]